MHRAVAKKKILAQELGQKKNSGRLKIPPPPHHFSNGPSLTDILASFREMGGTEFSGKFGPQNVSLDLYSNFL